MAVGVIKSATVERIAPPSPKLADISILFRGLFNRNVAVTRSAKPCPDLTVVSIYHNDAGILSAICLTDLTLAAGSGAALALVPPGVASDAVRAKKLTELLVDAFGEVANVFAQLFNVPGRSHFKLYQVMIAPPTIPPAVREVMNKPSTRADYDVAIPDYGVGHFAVLTV